MWLRGAGSGKLTGVHPAYPETEKAKNDRDIAVLLQRDISRKTAEQGASLESIHNPLEITGNL